MDPDLRGTARAGNINDLYAIIQSKPDILDKELFVETPLHLRNPKIKAIIQKKLNPERLSPLHLALQNKHSDTVRRLVKFDSKLIRVKGREGLTPLHFVAKTDDQDQKVDLLFEFLDVCSSSINDVTIPEETALHIAVKSSSFYALQFLLIWLQKTYKGEVLCLTDERGKATLCCILRCPFHNLRFADQKLLQLAGFYGYCFCWNWLGSLGLLKPYQEELKSVKLELFTAMCNAVSSGIVTSFIDDEQTSRNSNKRSTRSETLPSFDTDEFTVELDEPSHSVRMLVLQSQVQGA
ncbi:unnamed protein product [Camellia sinensis]